MIQRNRPNEPIGMSRAVFVTRLKIISQACITARPPSTIALSGIGCEAPRPLAAGDVYSKQEEQRTWNKEQRNSASQSVLCSLFFVLVTYKTIGSCEPTARASSSPLDT